MDFDEREKRRERRNSIIRSVVLLSMIIVGILFVADVITFETLNVPKVPEKPELQLRWDEFKWKVTHTSN